MLFGTPPKLAKINQFSVTISGSAIKRVTEFRYLGGTFDEHLTRFCRASIVPLFTSPQHAQAPRQYSNIGLIIEI